MKDAGFDVIGDVHGHAAELVRLLEVMGYAETAGGWRHPTRQAVFVGDLTDRGPEHVDLYCIVRAMVDNEAAQIVAGNHEFNAVLWQTPNPDKPGTFLRNRLKKRHQHEDFLGQVGEDSAEHGELIEWFTTMPLWLELDGLRIVHACWDQDSIDLLSSQTGPNNCLTPDLVLRAARTGSPEWQAIEHLLKGPEITISPAYLDANGKARTQARFNWWTPGAADSVRLAAVIPTNAQGADGSCYPDLPETSVVDPPVEPYTDHVPVIYGHYWMSPDEVPTPTGSYSACVDYSAGKGGPLVAYRWSGERVLTADNFASSRG